MIEKTHASGCPAIYYWTSPWGIRYRTGFVEDSLCDCPYGTIEKLKAELAFYKEKERQDGI